MGVFRRSSFSPPLVAGGFAGYNGGFSIILAPKYAVKFDEARSNRW